MIKNWIQKQVPLSVVIQDWARPRDLIFIHKNEIPKKILNFFYQYEINQLPGGLFLGDYRNYHLAIICSKYNIVKAQIMQLIQELEEEVQNNYKNHEDVFFVQLEKEFSNELLLERNLFPLFIVLWKPERPLFESLLSGGEKESNVYINELNNIKFIQTRQNIKNEAEKLKYRFKKIVFSESKYIYKGYVRETNHEVVGMFSSWERENYSSEYWMGLVDQLIYSDYRILKVEELIQQNYLQNQRLGLIELYKTGYMNGIFYNFSAFFKRASKRRVYILPDYKRKKKLITSLNIKKNDEVLFFPTMELDALKNFLFLNNEAFFQKINKNKIGTAYKLVAE
ncbi:MAG: hypothetical protein NZ853_01995 [Leptospiraceae bacterium]|nr:hypothetical protein [Leptospiraceae bacterium]MDW7976002.1 hypothetical protein [Leptospiraceae bacterium]